MKAVDERFEALEATRERFVHLETVCTTLEKLDDLDAADLFWRASTPEIDATRHLSAVRAKIEGFAKSLAEIETERDELLDYDDLTVYTDAGQGGFEIRTFLAVSAAAAGATGTVHFCEPIPIFAVSCTIASYDLTGPIGAG